MTTRTINKTLLRSKIKEIGLAEMAVAAGCSPGHLGRMTGSKYESVPGVDIALRICKKTGLSVDDLFPEVDLEDQAS